MLRSIPPKTSTGSQRQIKSKIQSGVSGRIFGQSFGIGSPTSFGTRNIKKNNWKPNIYKKKYKSYSTTPIYKERKVIIDKFDEKDKFIVIIEGTKEYKLLDNTLIIKDEKISIPKNVELKTNHEKNGLLILTFKRRNIK